MTDHHSEEPPGEVPNHTRLFVIVLLIEAKDALITLQKDNWAVVVQLVVQRLDDLLLKVDQLLLLNLDVPLVLDKAHHSVEAG